MDSLRLLTRGSANNSKIAEPVKDNNKASASQLPKFHVTNTAGQKRKRDDAEVKSTVHLTIEEVIRVQRTHNVKITDLVVLHKHDDGQDAKVQKAAAKLYPQPLQSFSSLKRSHVKGSIITNLTNEGYRGPTDIQLAAVPLLLSSSDVQPNLLAVAPTGSGKTLAFLIPVIDKIAKRHKLKDEEPHVSTIILAPTRELVSQIVAEGQRLCTNTGVRITGFRKGMRLVGQADDSVLKGGQQDDRSTNSESEAESDGGTSTQQINSFLVKSDIMVSTPLGLAHMITATGLPEIHDLILDEADVLLDPLFREQTMSIWLACTAPSLRVSLWSATIGASIEELAINTIQNRETKLSIAKSDRPRLLRCIVGLKDTSLPNIQHKLIYTSTEAGKLTGLRQIIRPPPATETTTKQDSNTIPRLTPPFLVFTQTIARAEALYEEIKYDLPPRTTSDTTIPRIALLHSSLSATSRAKIMTNFRQGYIWILITTDLLSRGIDFHNINAVINYDIPTTTASYIHRAGRTGRQGKHGTCLTLYTRDDVNYLRPIVNVIQKSYKVHSRQDEEIIPKWLMDALPNLTKEVKKELKLRGVDVRRGVKESDDQKERRRKAREKIGSKSGYERKLENNRRGMVEGSQRRRNKENMADQGDSSDAEDFGGFD